MSEKSALLVVDMQRDFMPCGALAIPHGKDIIPFINEQLNSERFALKIASKDIHPESHSSFKTQGGEWPPHCVNGTQGSEFAEGLEVGKFDVAVEKGFLAKDSYSAFFKEQGGGERTDLFNLLGKNAISRLYVTGVALDFCVKATVLDAMEFGLDVTLLRRGVAATSEEKAEPILKELEGKGVILQ